MSINGNQGQSTCPPGEERFEEYHDRIVHRDKVHYDYRTLKGDLFTTVANSLDEARDQRDRWLERHGYKR